MDGKITTPLGIEWFGFLVRKVNDVVNYKGESDKAKNEFAIE